MEKKYLVRLTAEECALARSVVQRLSGGSQKVRRAQILLQADTELNKSEFPDYSSPDHVNSLLAQTAHNLRHYFGNMPDSKVVLALQEHSDAFPPSIGIPVLAEAAWALAAKTEDKRLQQIGPRIPTGHIWTVHLKDPAD